MGEDITLYQFPYSTFNEKARWTLDYKKIPHSRVNLMPGPHARFIKKLTGQTATPVLKIGDRVIAGSAAIIDALEEVSAAPALLPVEDAVCQEARAIQQRFDEDLGVRSRRAVLASLMDDPAYMANMFSTGRNWFMRFTYRHMMPLVLGRVREGNGITGPEAIEDGMNAINEALDLVHAQSQSTGYLCGDSFSVADLTACAHLAPTVNPPDCAMTRPEPMPQKFRDQLAEWAKHPGTKWVLKIYRDHRPASSAKN